MTREQVKNYIIEMMVKTFELEREKVAEDARLYEDLDLDSIDALDMVVKLQELTHRRVEEAELRALRTVGDVIELVVNAGGGAEQQVV